MPMDISAVPTTPDLSRTPPKPYLLAFEGCSIGLLSYSRQVSTLGESLVPLTLEHINHRGSENERDLHPQLLSLHLVITKHPRPLPYDNPSWLYQSHVLRRPPPSSSSCHLWCCCKSGFPHLTVDISNPPSVSITPRRSSSSQCHVNKLTHTGLNMVETYSCRYLPLRCRQGSR